MTSNSPVITNDTSKGQHQLTEAQQYYIGLFERWQKMSTDPKVEVDNPELWKELHRVTDFDIVKERMIKQISINFKNKIGVYSETKLYSNPVYYNYIGVSKLKNAAWLLLLIILYELDHKFYKLTKLKFIDLDFAGIENFPDDKSFLSQLQQLGKLDIINCINCEFLENQQLKKELENYTSPVITNDKGEIIIYQNPNGSIEVNLNNGQIWLSQDKIASLFEKDRTSITKHIKNIYTEGELDLNSTSAKISQVQIEGGREVNRQIDFYNLDMILSIGYRVNSRLATKFRQWANTVLKDYILKGYSVNEDRLDEIKDNIKFLIENKKLLSNDTFDLLLDRYVQSLVTLNQYDENKIPELPDEYNIDIGLEESWQNINKTKLELIKQREAWDGFGKELDNKFSSTIGALNQTYGSQPVYNRSQKLANLLYLIVKNHSFVDGNKRIGAILFVYFCSRAGIVIDPNNLISLTLLIAQSNPNDKDNLIKLIQIIIN